jgi:Putative peptidoglycan binding domain
MKSIIVSFIGSAILLGASMPVSAIPATRQNHTNNIYDSRSATIYTKCQNSININSYCFEKGNQGVYIQKISMLLSELGFYRGKIKKLFDKELESSIIKFQKKQQIKPADGIVGFETLFWICKAQMGTGCTASVKSGWRP